MTLSTLQQQRARLFDIATHPVEGDLANRHQPLFAALPEDPHDTHVLRQLRHAQRYQLRNAESTRVKKLEQGPVAQTQWPLQIRSRQKAFHVFLCQALGQAARTLRRVDIEGGIDVNLPLAQSKLITALEARQDPGRGTRASACLEPAS